MDFQADLFAATRRTTRHGLTVLELIICLGTIGVLTTLVLPAVQSVREATRRFQCVDHLRQVGLAIHEFESGSKHIPAGWSFDTERSSSYGWAVSLLPYVGDSGLVDGVDPKQAVTATRHDIARGTSLPWTICPSDIIEPTFEIFYDEDGPVASLIAPAAPMTVSLTQLPTANYVGVFGTIEPDDSIPAPLGDGAFVEMRQTRLKDFSRGLSQTVIVGERTMAQVPSTWLGVPLEGEDAAARLVGSTLQGINNSLADECDFSSRHSGGANFLWADGHVSLISQSIDLLEYHRIPRLRNFDPSK